MGSAKEKYDAMYDLYHEVLKKGLKPLSSEPLFSISKYTDLYGENKKTYVCCIPLEPESAPDDALVLKSCRAFSCLYYGSYDLFAEVWNTFGQKVRELSLKPIDYPRLLGIVAPYTAREFKPEDYVSRIVIPIAPDDNEKI